MDTFGRITESMMQSNTFKSLNKAQRLLMVACTMQNYGKRKPERDYTDIDEISENCFYFNVDIAINAYELYKPTDSSTFYKDMQVLIDKGFIERVSSGKSHRKKSIYRYSSKWQTEN